jgi:signal transduction histidine kinase/CheY-like chemotaxis protein
MVIASALVFALGDLMAEVWSDSPGGLWLGMTLLYVGLFSMSAAWWDFTGRYIETYEPEIWARLKRFPWVPTRVLIGINAVFLVVMATNSWHGLFLDPNPGSRSTYGPVWYVAAATNYLVVMGVLSIQVALSFIARNRAIRSQCRYMAAAILVPLVANIIFVSTPVPLAYDPTALGMAVSCSLFLFAVSRLDLFALERLSVPDILSEDTDAILFIRSDCRLLYANERASILMGEDLLVRGTSVSEAFGKKIPSFCLDEVLQARFEGARPIVGGAHHLFNRSGRDQWIQIDVTRFRWHRGRSLGFCIRLRDRTELHEANIAMEDHAILLEAIDKATGEGLVVQDSMGRIRYANEAFARLWDIPIADLTTWGSEKVICEVGARVWGNSGDAFETAWSRGGDQFDLDFRLTADVQLVDGRIMEVCTFPIKPAQTFSGRVWRTTDVTQQRQDAQAMIHSQKLKGLGVLAGGIAHDFNNLLAAMLGNAELAREAAPPNSPVLEYLEDVETSAHRAADLTAQMLAYTGKATFSKELINLSELIREAGDLLSVSISKNIRVHYQMEETLPMLEGGLGQLRQIAMNLVTNAADAIGDSPTGCIEIETGRGRPEALGFPTVSLSYGTIPNCPVFLRVLDNGDGMDQDTLNRIFDPFFTTKISGRGLGLAATLGIIQSHEASLCVESTPGEGTSFTVFFPSVTRTNATKEVHALLKHLPITRQTVLIVDDEASVRAMLKKMLSTMNFKVLEACDGYEAIDVYEEHSEEIDLVILDMSMPGMDGEATWWSLRKRTKDLPILLSSGYPEQMVNLEGARSAETDGFIQKPYRKRDLTKQLALLLARPSQAQR